MDPGAISVTIYGQEYTVRSDGDPEYVRRIASYLDRRMREVAKQSSQVSSVRVAILAALNITDELFQERESGSSQVERIEERAARLVDSLERSILSADESSSSQLEKNADEA